MSPPQGDAQTPFDVMAERRAEPAKRGSGRAPFSRQRQGGAVSPRGAHGHLSHGCGRHAQPRTVSRGTETNAIRAYLWNALRLSVRCFRDLVGGSVARVRGVWGCRPSRGGPAPRSLGNRGRAAAPGRVRRGRANAHRFRICPGSDQFRRQRNLNRRSEGEADAALSRGCRIARERLPDTLEPCVESDRLGLDSAIDHGAVPIEQPHCRRPKRRLVFHPGNR